MRKVLVFFISVLFCVTAYAGGYRAALVADMDSGRVLYSENANNANYPASLTKIMTLYLTFDALEHGRLHLDDYLIVSNSAANAEPVKLGLSAGSKISVEDAIKAVAVVSANDVARVLAENLQGGKEGNFAELMTRVARQIGLSDITNFENSSGLPNDDHMSTARDIALLSMAVYKHYPQYWKYFGIKTWTFGGKTYTNGNRLLGGYPGCDGMKTGYTKKSKYSLVATAIRDNHHLVAVVLGADDKDVRAAAATNMLNRGFKEVGVDTTASYTYQPVAQQQYPITQSNPMAKYASDAPKTKAVAVSSGGAGVQFGAFSTRDAAARQVQNVSAKLGVTPKIEQSSNGLYRVRVSGLSESSAQTIKNNATSYGIDCYIFH